jgi:hypothetical protein
MARYAADKSLHTHPGSPLPLQRSMPEESRKCRPFRESFRSVPGFAEWRGGRVILLGGVTYRMADAA